MDYLEPLRGPPVELDLRDARFLLLKHKYLELLCLRYSTPDFGPGTAGQLVNGSTTVEDQEKEDATDYAVEQVGHQSVSRFFYLTVLTKQVRRKF